MNTTTTIPASAGSIDRREAPTPPPAIIDGLLRKGGVMSVIAPPKSGLSTMALELAIDAAAGSQWLCHGCAKSKVLLVDSENMPFAVKERTDAILGAKGIPRGEVKDSLDFALLRGDAAKSVENILTLARERDYDLVVIDSVMRLAPLRASGGESQHLCDILDRLASHAPTKRSAFAVFQNVYLKTLAFKKAFEREDATLSHCDTNLVVREVSETDGFVMKCKSRSFPQPLPLALGFEWPLWKTRESLAAK